MTRYCGFFLRNFLNSAAILLPIEVPETKKPLDRVA
nr:MAG TPA: hypothetical protein [Caudoviricetes sp.]